MTAFFVDDDSYTGPPLDAEMIRQAERVLGVRLPAAYLEVLAGRNGGVPFARCCATPFPSSWAEDHIEIGVGSRYLVAEWGYPDVGVVLCRTPSGGHDTVMLDYSRSGPQGEPSVAYVDEDRVPQRLATSFRDFAAGLTRCLDSPMVD